MAAEGGGTISLYDRNVGVPAEPIDLSEYTHGSLISVRMVNFMTHRNTVVMLGPRLNLVIGPNGSGKSSFVSALALGLGGTPSMLDRAKKLDGFVKHGESAFAISVFLRDETAECGYIRVQHRFTRPIRGRSGGSEYLLDKKRVPERVVLEKLAWFGISVGNLCQFLPQERIQKFTTLTPPEILNETEAALDQSLVRDHEFLKRNRTEAEDMKTKLDRLEQRHRECVQEVAKYEKQEEALRRREAAKKKASELELLLPWMQYFRENEGFAKLSERQKVLEEEAGRLEDLVRISKEKFDATKKVVSSEQRSAKECQDAIDSAKSSLGRITQRMERLRKKLVEKSAAVLSLDAKIERAKRGLKEEEARVKHAERTLQSMGDVERIKAKEAKAREELEVAVKVQNGKKEEAKKAREEYESISDQVQSAAEAVTAARRQFTIRMRNMKQSGEPQCMAVAELFVKLSKSVDASELGLEPTKIVGPIAHFVSVLDPAQTRYEATEEMVHSKDLARNLARADRQIRDLALDTIDMALSLQQKLRFVTADQSTFDRIAQLEFTVRGARGRKQGVSAMLVTSEEMGRASRREWSTSVDPEIRRKLAELGFTMCLGDIVDAPPAVLAALDRMMHLNCVFLSMDPSGRGISAAEEALRSCRAAIPDGLHLVTPSRSVRTFKSRLVGSRFVYRSTLTASSVNYAWIMQPKVGKSEVDRLLAAQSAAEERLKEAETARDVAEADDREAQKAKIECKSKVQTYVSDRRRYDEARRDLDRALRQLEDKQRLATEDSHREKVELVCAMRTTEVAILNLGKDLVASAASIREAHLAAAAAHAGLMAAEALAHRAERAHSAVAQNATEANARAHAHRAQYNAARQSLRMLRDAAKAGVDLAEAYAIAEAHEILRPQNDDQHSDDEDNPAASEKDASSPQKSPRKRPPRAASSSKKSPVSSPARRKAAPKTFDEVFLMDEDGVRAKIAHFQREASQVFRDLEDLDPETIAQNYEQAKAEEERLSEQIKRHRTNLVDIQAKLELTTARWTQQMTKHCRDLNERLQASFAKLGIRSHITFEVDTDDYSKCGIEIKVAFRQGAELQALSGNTQSGGERAITTMLYLLSLQLSTRCPFRCVDEMNQGMDAKNERFVFNEIMRVCRGDGLPPSSTTDAPNSPASSSAKSPPKKRAASSSSRRKKADDDEEDDDDSKQQEPKLAIGRQYIVVTPKLLPDLKFEDHCRVHFVFNGPQIHGKKELTLDHRAIGAKEPRRDSQDPVVDQEAQPPRRQRPRIDP